MRVIDARHLAADDVAREVASVTRAGGVVIFPTDTVYGIGCDPGDRDAVARIFALKGRSRTKPLALHLSSVEEFLAVAGTNGAARALCEAFLPGPLTVIVSRPVDVDPAVTGGLSTLGLRVPGHALARAILAATGPLAATSANLSGAPAFTGVGASEVLPQADLRVEDGATTMETESTVIDVSQAQARIVRGGATPTDMLERVLGTKLS